MGIFSIVEGNVVSQVEIVDRVLTQTGVDAPAGTSVTVNLGVQTGKLRRILVLRTTPTDVAYSIDIFDKSSLDPIYTVFGVNNDDPTLAKIDVVFPDGIPFNNDTDPEIYIQITPTTGLSHEFSIRVQVETSTRTS